MPWNFRDYQDESGRNLVAKGLGKTSPAVRARINARLVHIRRLQALGKPHVVFFSGKWSGICEIRIEAEGVQHRLLSCRGPGEKDITILLPTFKKRSDVTNQQKDKALERMKVIKHHPERSCDHDYEK